MAFPTVQDRVTSEEGGGTTSHSIAMPATVDSGDLLVAFYGMWDSGDYGTLWPPDWEPFLWDYNSGNVRVIAAWKDADGTEGGTSITVSTLDANESSHVVYRITGHEDPSTQPPQAVSFFGPDTYRGLTAARDFRTALAVSHLPVETATEDPPSYTYVSSDEWTAATVAVPPASSGTFPTLEERSFSINADATSHTVDLPDTINSGDLLIGIFGRGSSNDDDVSWPAGWTEFASVGTPSGDGNRLSFAYRQADGTEGASITVTTTASGSSSHVVYRLTGAADPSTTAPEASTTNGNSATPDPPSLTFSGGSDTHLWLAVADHKSKHGEQLATGTSTSPDPPSLTPTGGAKDYLWIATCESFDGSDATGAPTNYTNLQTISDFRTAIATAERELNASSEDPGTFTFGASADWVAATAVVHPASTDTTAPTLSSPSGSATGTTTADGSVSTDEGNGTLYWICDQSNIAPSVAQIQAGQDDGGAAADDSGNQSVSATGTQNVSASGLSASTTYFFHFQHQDAAGNDSTVVTSASFTTNAAGGLSIPVAMHHYRQQRD